MKEKTEKKRQRIAMKPNQNRDSKLWGCPLWFSGEPGKSIIRQRLTPG